MSTSPKLSEDRLREVKEAKWFRITNLYEKHNGFQYVDGLNVDTVEFESDPRQACVPGGLNFTTREHVSDFYPYGIYLRVVRLPTEEDMREFRKTKPDLPDFQMVYDPWNYKWRANMLILGRKYSLFDPKTYTLFGLDMPDIDSLCTGALISATRDSYESFLLTIAEIRKNGRTMVPCEQLVNEAAFRGNLAILDYWWTENRSTLRYSKEALDIRVVFTRAGVYIPPDDPVLVWFRDHNLDIKCSYPIGREGALVQRVSRL